MAKSLEQKLQDIENALDLVAPSDTDRLQLFGQLGAWAALKKVEGKKTRITDYAAFSEFFSNWFTDARVDLLSKKLMQLNRGEWEPINIPVLRSNMHTVGFDRAFVEDHLANWTQEQTPELLVDFPEYDGEDHIRQIAETSTYKNFSVDDVEAILKEWMAGVWRRVQDQNKQNRFLLLRGPQGVGKDWLIRLLCDPWGVYFTNFTMQSQERDVFDQVSSSILVNFSEFDQTEKMNTAFLKDMVTKYKATFRRSHAKDAISRRFHCSFIGTTNQQYIMRDETGNRRFAIIDIDKMDWQKMGAVNYTQAWSQARHLAVQGFKVSKAIQHKIDDFMEKETPENDLELNVIELWNERVGSLMRQKGVEKLNYVQVQQVFDGIRRDLNLRSQRVVQSIIRRNNGQFKNDNIRYYRLCVINFLAKTGPKGPVRKKTDLPNYAKGLGKDIRDQ